MRCIQVCPENAKHLDEMMLNAVAEKMEPLFRERKKTKYSGKKYLLIQAPFCKNGVF